MRATFETGRANGWGSDKAATRRVAHTRRKRFGGGPKRSLLDPANGAYFLVVILALLQWQRATEQARLPLESFFESLMTAIRYVRYAPGLRIVLARNVLFALFISAIPAMMPVVGLRTRAMPPALFPDQQRPSGFPHSRQKRPRIRIHCDPNAKHYSRPWRKPARLQRGRIPKAR
jgi:hypothetical protein